VATVPTRAITPIIDSTVRARFVIVGIGAVTAPPEVELAGAELVASELVVSGLAGASIMVFFVADVMAGSTGMVMLTPG
jgi:hypothetical protein